MNVTDTVMEQKRCMRPQKPLGRIQKLSCH